MPRVPSLGSAQIADLLHLHHSLISAKSGPTVQREKPMHRPSLVDYEAAATTEAATPSPAGTEGCCGSPIAALATPIFICRLLFRSGRRPEARRARQPPLPFTLGHETPARRGGGARGARGQQGQALRRLSVAGCGTCGLCARGRRAYVHAPRALGVTVDGGYAPTCCCRIRAICSTWRDRARDRRH